MNYRNYLISKNKAFKNDFFFQKTVSISKFLLYVRNFGVVVYDKGFQPAFGFNGHKAVPLGSFSNFFKIRALDLIKLLKVAKKNKIKFFNLRHFDIYYTVVSEEDSEKRRRMTDSEREKAIKEIDCLFSEIEKFDVNILDIFVSENIFNLLNDKEDSIEEFKDKFLTKAKKVKKKKYCSFEYLVDEFNFFRTSFMDFLKNLNKDKKNINIDDVVNFFPVK